ncbi:PepSY-associated TM helix domain-containing protein [Brachybacterium sacelli]|uniref:PepSY-associated TM helix domain-containing protein n=1 Tax=Brachybacterium sacelli TaxID=173364 RepID=UPI00247A9537|nr:PepSY-associated TM helix domain-containing protein [Brachybacterium sacelli]
MHFYAGIAVGPFLLVVALSGALYALSTPVERMIYSDELTAPISGEALPLADQVSAATDYVGQEETLVAVRPAPEPGETTRVMYSGTDLGESETRAIFVDPATAEVRGDLTTYGTSGALPVRTWIDQLHRGLHLGDFGRNYSEFAASWMAVVALAGIGLWVARAVTSRSRREALLPRRDVSTRRGTLSWHASGGIVLALGMLFLSATGITWSQHAGTHVTDLRAALGWTTPAVTTQLGEETAVPDEHAGHAGHGGGESGHPSAEPGTADPAMFDHALEMGQAENIDSTNVEILPPTSEDTAWVVQEIQRSYPTMVDSVAIDMGDMEIVDRVDFEDFGLMAKLARWGVDIHMGTMFGLVNQIAVALVALAIAAMVVLGYRMWWQRRPTRGGTARVGKPPARGALQAAPWWGIGLVALVALAIGLFLPMVGFGLIGFLVVDLMVQARRTDRSPH